MIPLENVARKYSVVYLDANVFSIDDRSQPDVKTRNFISSNSNGKADSYWVQRHLEFTSSLYKTINDNENITTNSLTLWEVRRLAEKLCGKFDRLGPVGKYPELRQIMSNYFGMMKTLTHRLEDVDSELGKFLCRNKMHIPRTRHFRKKHLDGTTDYPDACMVAEAIKKSCEYQKNSVIVSSDNDVANLVWNWGTDYHTGRLPQAVEEEFQMQGEVAVVSPLQKEWSQDLGVRFVCDSVGRLISPIKTEMGKIA